jgi:hypothetical protein
MPRRRHDHEYWEQLVDEFEQGDDSAPAFARAHRVRVATFRSWLYRLRREREQAQDRTESAFVEVVPVETPFRSNGVSLGLPGGLEVHLAELPPPSYLAELCRELSE